MIRTSFQMTFGQRALLGVLSVFFASGCSIFAVRPAQEMSNMELAIKAAKEVGADLYAPEVYRAALEKELQARKEYRFKNFLNAKTHAEQARVLAEKAEFESIVKGAQRDVAPADPLAEPSYAPEPVATPSVDATHSLAPPPSGNPPK
jgi:hypothetical protein